MRKLKGLTWIECDFLIRTQRNIVKIEKAMSNAHSPDEYERLLQKVRQLRNQADDVTLELLDHYYV